MAKQGRLGWFTARGKSAHLGLCWLLFLGALSCSPDSGATVDGSLVRLHLSLVDATASRADLTIAAAPDATSQPVMKTTSFTSGPLDVLGVTFPAGTRGLTSYQVRLYNDAACLLSSGQASFTLDSDGTFDVVVAMTQAVACGMGVKVDVQVANLSGASGTVTSNPPGISCQGPGGNGCSAVFMVGTNVTLTAAASTGTFAGWSGGTCSGLGTCMFTTAQDVQLQAVFSTCRGWCPEKLPFNVSANLNAVSGTTANNVVVAGDAGTVLQWNGLSWQQLTPPSGGGVALRAVAGRTGGSSIYIAGDGGTILRLQGTFFAQITNGSTATLRAAAIGDSGNIYFVGDGGTAASVSSSGTIATAQNPKATVALYSISENPAGGKDDYYLVGAVSGAQGFAEGWDGVGSVTPQMVSPGMNIAGNIYAMLCGVSYHYAAGDGGMIIRRSSASNNSDKWMLATSPTNQTLRGLWASIEGTVYAAGDMGTIVQFDGATWTKVSLNPPINTNLRAIWGTSSTNIYAVGDSGTILHYLP